MLAVTFQDVISSIASLFRGNVLDPESIDQAISRGHIVWFSHYFEYALCYVRGQFGILLFPAGHYSSYLWGSH